MIGTNTVISKAKSALLVGVQPKYLCLGELPLRLQYSQGHCEFTGLFCNACMVTWL